MADSYSISQYLLDRANIHDTIRRLALYYDTKNVSGLASDVFAPGVTVDYSALTGAPAAVLDNETLVALFGNVLNKYDSTQHVVSNIVADLPQPGSQPRPDKAAVHAHANGHMVKHDAKGGPLIQNGVFYDFEVARDPKLEKQGANPWRVTLFKVSAALWENGNPAVHDGAFGAMKGN